MYIILIFCRSYAFLLKGHGVTHSYSTRHILKCNYIIALDQLVKQHLINSGYPEHQIFIVPNMINIPPRRLNDFSQKNRICYRAPGRFVTEKGFNYLIEAISYTKG